MCETIHLGVSRRNLKSLALLLKELIETSSKSLRICCKMKVENAMERGSWKRRKMCADDALTTLKVARTKDGRELTLKFK